MTFEEITSKIKYNNVWINSYKEIIDPCDIVYFTEKNINLSGKSTALIKILPCNPPKGQFEYDYCIFSDNPRDTFRQVLELFAPKINKISQTAQIENSIIGENCSIGHNSVIMNAEIGNNVIIGCNCTIGGTGFGYEKDENGNYQLIPHIGNVILKDGVEIGNNTCIDRAVMGSTILEENVKVDNLVHIAHGVHIKRNSVIIANTMIAGSVEIGENTWVAPSANILNKKKVGNNAVIGMGAVVLKDVNDKETIIGNPGKLLIK